VARSERPWRPGQYHIRQAAMDRLKPRFGDESSPGRYFLNPDDAVYRVATAATKPHWQTCPEPTVDECLDALTVLPDAHGDLENAHNRLDRDELNLIHVAHAAGKTWDEIGLALGYKQPRAAAQAKARHTKLRKKFPSWSPPEEKPADETSTGDPDPPGGTTL
jgi:hypothetical protein